MASVKVENATDIIERYESRLTRNQKRILKSMQTGISSC
jgi:hypothetical protein